MLHVQKEADKIENYLINQLRFLKYFAYGFIVLCFLLISVNKIMYNFNINEFQKADKYVHCHLLVSVNKVAYNF